MTSITVCGTAQLGVVPDQATLELGLTHVARAPALAMDVIAARSGQLADLLAELGFTTADWATQGVSVAEEWEWKRDTNVKVGHRATSGVVVRIEEDLDRIGKLLSRAVSEASADVRSLQWSISEAHPARQSLLGAAALDAVRRADAYAQALGIQRGDVQEVSDLPITSDDGGQPREHFAMRAKAADTSATINVNPGEIELHASVHIRFGTTAPAQPARTQNAGPATIERRLRRAPSSALPNPR